MASGNAGGLVPKAKTVLDRPIRLPGSGMEACPPRHFVPFIAREAMPANGLSAFSEQKPRADGDVDRQTTAFTAAVKLTAAWSIVRGAHSSRIHPICGV